MKAIRLQTEYLTEPLGLGNPRPRFYWNCEGGVKQTAYQIVCTRDGETVWDSVSMFSLIAPSCSIAANCSAAPLVPSSHPTMILLG